MSVYTDHGYANRKAYLIDLADQIGAPLEIVFALADILGPTEDFDGLVTELEDAAMFGDF